MEKNKIRSFTLSELLVVLVLTAIVVGLAFGVLRLVQKQLKVIDKNFLKQTELLLFEQRLCHDFNTSSHIIFESKRRLKILSENDTTVYNFDKTFVLINEDTLKLKITIRKALFNGQNIADGVTDAISLSAEEEMPKYNIFVSRRNDVNVMINQNGF